MKAKTTTGTASKTTSAAEPGPVPTLFSIVEAPTHPRLSDLYRRLGLAEMRLPSQRKAIQALKRVTPAWVVAEFFYGFGNNYAGANVSNLDVFLSSLQKHAPAARVIVLVTPDQARYVPLLAARFPLHAVLTQPVRATAMETILCAADAATASPS